MDFARRNAAAFVVAVLGLGCSQAGAQELPIGAPQDWSSRAVISAAPMTPEALDAAGRSADIPQLYRDPRYVASVLRRIEAEAEPMPAARSAAAFAAAASPAAAPRALSRPRHRSPHDNAPDPQQGGVRDWSNVLGGGSNGAGGRGAPGVFPAKYNLDIFAPPSCSGDFVVYTTNAAGAGQSGTAQTQWTGNFTGTPGNGQTLVLGLPGPRQVTLTASSNASANTGASFYIGGTNAARAGNLRDAINRWASQTGLRAEGSGSTVTIIANTAGDMPATSVSETLGGGFDLSRSYSGSSTPGQPTIVAFNQLYQGTCNGPWNLDGATKAPNVMWAYNTGNGFIAETSPVLSYLDGGKQVAFVQRSGNTLQLVLLKPGSGSGSVANPAAPVSVTRTAYRACANAGGCYTTLAFNTGAGANNVTTSSVPTYSAPFVDYAGDILWVGDGNGILHKFTGVFQGTPAEVTSGGFPKAVEPGLKLSSPVYDSNGSVFVGSESGAGNAGGRLYRINAATGAIVATSAKLALASTTGLRESPILDLRSNSVYAFVFNDNTSSYTDPARCRAFNNEIDGCRAVFRFPVNFAAGSSGARAWIGRGNSTTRALYAGGFDDAFYNSTDGTGNLYITGGRNDNTFYATLWKVPITAGMLGAPVRGPELGARDRYTGSDDQARENLQNLSPVTVIKNPHTGLEHLYASVASHGNASGCGNGTYAGGACLYMYRLTDLVTRNDQQERWTLRIAAGSFDWGTFSYPGMPASGAGSITIDGTVLTAGVQFSSSGNRAEDRAALVAAIAAVPGYSAQATGGCATVWAGAACDLVVTRDGFGNVADNTLTAGLSEVSLYAHVDGATAGTTVEAIAWTTALVPSAALAVTAGNGEQPAIQIPGGTGGIVVDNVRPTAEAGTSQVYFTQGGVTGNAIQVSQSALE